MAFWVFAKLALNNVEMETLQATKIKCLAGFRAFYIVIINVLCHRNAGVSAA